MFDNSSLISFNEAFTDFDWGKALINNPNQPVDVFAGFLPFTAHLGLDTGGMFGSNSVLFTDLFVSGSFGSGFGLSLAFVPDGQQGMDGSKAVGGSGGWDAIVWQMANTTGGMGGMLPGIGTEQQEVEQVGDHPAEIDRVGLHGAGGDEQSKMFKGSEIPRGSKQSCIEREKGLEEVQVP